MAESAALEVLDEPVRELAAMEDALALARKSRSKVGESLALINLADIRLRRKEFGDASTCRASRSSSPSNTTTSDRSRPARRISASRCSASAARAKASATPTRRSPSTSAPAPPPRSRRCSANTATISRKPATTGRARVLSPRAQAQRGHGGGRAPALGARDAGEVRVGQEAARNRAPQSPECAQFGGAREPGVARARLVAVRGDRRDRAARASACTTGGFASTTACSRRRTRN